MIRFPWCIRPSLCGFISYSPLQSLVVSLFSSSCITFFIVQRFKLTKYLMRKFDDKQDGVILNTCSLNYRGPTDREWGPCKHDSFGFFFHMLLISVFSKPQIKIVSLTGILQGRR